MPEPHFAHKETEAQYGLETHMSLGLQELLGPGEMLHLFLSDWLSHLFSDTSITILRA